MILVTALMNEDASSDQDDPSHRVLNEDSNSD